MKAFRRVLRTLGRLAKVREATPGDLEEAAAWLHPNRPNLPLARSPSVTAWVAVLGRHLLGFVELARRGEGAEELFLLVTEINLPAIRLYRKLGFETVAIPELEEILDKEARATGRRRTCMRLDLPSEPWLTPLKTKGQRP